MTAPSPKVEQRLLPCPFCGGQARLLSGCPGSWIVQCVGCHAASDDRHQAAAAEAWNRRDLLTPSGDAEGRARITKDSYPEIIQAIRWSDEDNGTEHFEPGVGFVVDDPDGVSVPVRWLPHLDEIEKALAGLDHQAPHPLDVDVIEWLAREGKSPTIDESAAYCFVCGEHTPVMAMANSTPELWVANRFLNEYFEGWAFDPSAGFEAALTPPPSPTEAAGLREAFPQTIGRLHLGNLPSDGEFFCAHSHDIPKDHPAYWPAGMSEFDDRDPYCLGHAITETESDSSHCQTCISADLAAERSTQVSYAEDLARQFHEAYERLAPSFGYETREETRQFDPESPNGKLMIAVCAALAKSPPAAVGEEGKHPALGPCDWLADNGACASCISLGIPAGPTVTETVKVATAPKPLGDVREDQWLRDRVSNLTIGLEEIRDASWPGEDAVERIRGCASRWLDGSEERLDAQIRASLAAPAVPDREIPVHARRLIEKIADSVLTMQRETVSADDQGEAVAKECIPLFEALGMSNEGDGWGFNE